jgi:hypothetical protein
MTDDEKQSESWKALYKKIIALLPAFGTESAIGEGEYWVLDENWGPRQHKVCVFNLDMLRPVVVLELQKLLREFPDWGIMLAIDVPGKEEVWPPMGLIIWQNEIVDSLQRQYFPPEYQSIRYEGSRVGTDKD